MTTTVLACSRCGAINQASRPRCWTCYGPLSSAAARTNAGKRERSILGTLLLVSALVVGGLIIGALVLLVLLYVLIWVTCSGRF